MVGGKRNQPSDFAGLIACARGDGDQEANDASQSDVATAELPHAGQGRKKDRRIGRAGQEAEGTGSARRSGDGGGFDLPVADYLCSIHWSIRERRNFHGFPFPVPGITDEAGI